MDPDEVTKSVLTTHGKAKAIKFEGNTKENTFSLAGVAIPEIQLVEINKLDNLLQINLPNEKLAFAIKRFDRDGNTRIHMEDFAQALAKYPHEKYDSANYEQIGKVIYDFSGDGLSDIQQFAIRLLVNILLANGDAHLKNWSLLYQDQITPRLSPAYDIVTTCVYFEGEQEFALNFDKTKNWLSVSEENFAHWAKKVGTPWRAIKPHIDDTMEKVRTLWPEALKNLPMDEEHKSKLKEHWLKLHGDFRIE